MFYTNCKPDFFLFAELSEQFQLHNFYKTCKWTQNKLSNFGLIRNFASVLYSFCCNPTKIVLNFTKGSLFYVIGKWRKLYNDLLYIYGIWKFYNHSHIRGHTHMCRDFWSIQQNTLYAALHLSSMTTLLTHTVAHSARHSFRSKTNNHLIKNSRSLEFTWTKILKLSCTFSPSFTVLSFCFEFDSHTLSTLLSSSI